MQKGTFIFIIVVAILLLLGAWETMSQLSPTFRYVLPAPSDIASCIFQRADRFLFHSGVTLSEMLVALILAFVASFPLGWAMASSLPTRTLLQPAFVVIQCIPMFALAPILLLWFGQTFSAVVTCAALMIFFPLTLNIYKGLSTTPQHLLDYFRINGATSMQTFAKLQLPWALPQIFSGIRIATAVAGIGAVGGEWAGSENGLGMLLLESRRAGDLEMCFGALFCLSLLSIILFTAAIALEKRVALRRPLRQRKLRATLVVVFPVLCSLFVGCGQNVHNSSEVRMILDWFPNPNHVPIFVGMEKGVFEKHGIHLKLIKNREPGDALPFVRSGQAELFLWYMPSAIRALDKKADFEPVGVLIEKPLNCLLFRKDRGITKPADLNGKILGFFTDGTEKKYLHAVLRQNDIQPQQFRNVNVDLVASLATGKADAVWGAYWNIEGAHLESLGIPIDYLTMDLLGVPEHYELLVFAKKNSPQSTPSFQEAFRKALQECVDLCLANPDEAFNLYVQANPDKSAKTLAWERTAWNNTLHALARRPEIDPALWEKYRTWMAANGVL